MDNNFSGNQATGTGNQGMMSQVGQINQDFKERDIAQKAQSIGFGYVDIAKQPINPDVFDYISFDDCQRLKVLPFMILGDKLSVAMFDNQNPELLNLLKNLVQTRYLQILPYLASIEGIEKALEPFSNRYTAPTPTPATAPTEQNQSQNFETKIAYLKQLGDKLHKLGESQEGLNELEQGALLTEASDIHFQPSAGSTSVRFRIDGVLKTITELDNKVYNFFATQLKHKAGMKINVNDVPQDGRYSFSYENRQVDIRVSSLPTEFGDSIVLRILDNQNVDLDLVKLGYTDPTLSLLVNAQELSQGMIMVTGPTGSGKSTTLYTLLKNFNDEESKVITLEDPVEYKIPGVVQSPIKKASGYTFAKGLEAILRQDPDVIMVGEIRDENTAETAAQAALTGHVVLCTLHTNNALEALPRFINMGVKPYIAAPALNVIVAQRLVRKLCECKQNNPNLSPEELQFLQKELGNDLDLSQIAQPTGCDNCHNTGFKGRIVIAEGFKVNDELEEMILAEAPLSAIKQVLVEKMGMQTMLKDGLKKVLAGLTTVKEIKRVATL